ncbi:4-amino-4-deoxychorismate lyase [Kitasatospora sp. MMS16-BH015]|uniref:aminotransferase class IV n=1 Tax=Kitasatospora sp. MMS16-BH015 TaxID=2018025 RepID=UPI000CA2455C|nr:aminodeoxychorismate lyase [Kitasatospora sp. MMS16-BH015]AUG76011.1 4-amino-4-deoxychorismate lyase [Kitasatospora sp. MMS16-BH015]
MIWVNGVLAESGAATVSVLDHGLTTGDGVFETVKAVDGQPFAVRRHLDRLTRSARGLGLPDPDQEAVRAGVAEVLAANPMPLGRVRITYTGGIAPLGSERGTDPTTLVVAVGTAKPRPDTTAVVTVPWRRNEHSAVAGLKTTSYAENVVALAVAHRAGASESLFANTAGQLCEGTGSNVFVVLDGRLLTPPLASGCLAGITRQLVLDWTGAEEAELPFEVLERAEEIFLTSTLRDVQAVTRVDDRQLDGPGPVTLKAMALFAERSAETSEP